MLDTSRRDLHSAGVVAWIETDRRDDRRDGWTIDRVSLAGRWLVVNNNTCTYVAGSTAGGPPDPGHAVWATALAGRAPEELDVQVWQRTDRTTWVLHDGDGQVLAEFVIDEQRRMGTHESTVDVRLMSATIPHPLFESLGVELDQFLSTQTRVEKRGRESVPPTSTAPRSSTSSASSASSGPFPSDRTLATTPLRRATDLTAPLWAIRAAVDVETMIRRYQPEIQIDSRGDGVNHLSNNDFRELPSLAALIGALPELRLRHQTAAEQLESFCEALVSAERSLIRCTDEAWAMRKLRNTQPQPPQQQHQQHQQWNGLLTDPAVGLRILQPHAPAIRNLVLTMLERTDTELLGAVNAEHLSVALTAWTQHPKSAHRAVDTRRASAVRTAVSAYRVSVESGNPNTESNSSVLRQVRQLDRGFRWVRRRATLVDLVQKGSLSMDLPAATWMQLGVTVNTVERGIDDRLAATRKQAQRVRQLLT